MRTVVTSLRHPGPAAIGILAACYSASATAMPKRDLAVALLLAGATAFSRLPFRARLLPTWDAVQFALALSEYDIVKHQPHPPGYVLYVGAARVVNLLLGDPAASLTALSVAATAATVFLAYRLAWTLYGRSTALLAAVGLAVSPLFWLYGGVPLPYAVEASLATLVATLAWSMRGGVPRAVVWSALALGVAAGVRQSLLVLLFPLWLGTAWAGYRRWPPVLGGVAVVAAGVAASFLPMVWLTGGLGRYLGAAVELYDSTVRATTILGPPGGWLGNAARIAEASVMAFGLLLPVVVGLAVVGLRTVRRWGSREWLFAGWILPPLGVYTWVHFGQYAYLLTVLPAAYILLARGLVARLATARYAGPLARAGAGALGAGVLVAHAAFFVAARPVDVHDVAPEASWLAREGVALRALYRYRLWTSTAPALREHEAVIGAYVDAIRREFPPGATAIVTELGNPRSYPWFRHAGYYLPEFPVYHLRLGRFTPGYLSTREGDSMAALPGPEIRLPPGTRRLVWMVDYWNPLVPRPPGLREERLPLGRMLYVLDADRAPVEHGGYRLIPAPRRAALFSLDTPTMVCEEERVDSTCG